jgi:Holliday junction resolvase
MKYLKTLDHSWWFKVHGSPLQTAGVPDIIGCMHGQFIGFELKVGNNKTSKIQDYVIQKIREGGGAVCIAYSKKEVVAFITAHQSIFKPKVTP